MEKVYKKVCLDCGQAFETRGRNALRCPICAKKRKNALNIEYYQKERASQKAKLKALQEIIKKRHSPQPQKTINEVMKELTEYNREHNTHLSYGQYILLTEGGKPNGKKR